MNERELQRSVLYELKRDTWTLCVSASADGISFHGGEIGGMRILPSPVFAMRLEYADGTVCEIDSRTGWDTAEVVCEAGVLQMRVCGVSGAHGISVSVTGHPDDRGISFALDVQNHTQDCSVAEITYPVPAFAGEPLHLFLPDCCGRALMNAGETGFDGAYDYPGHNMSMQYFAFWGACGGVYLGV
ncbi:MAG: hypothetical protein IJ302_07375, partial [Clostridia bacterium]|nr:hypothetical protein [Clostridia bacterium]